MAEENTGPEFQSRSLAWQVAEVKQKVGRQPLTHEEILLLAADAILHSYTYEEKGYA